jgi:hypothetical protein
MEPVMIGARASACILFSGLAWASPGAAVAQQLTPGVTVEIPFPDSALPPTLFSRFTGGDPTPVLALRLPDDYDRARTYPLLVYVPGLHGNRSGNVGNALTIAGPRGWVVASLPLFKAVVDRGEVAGGLLVGFRDYPVIAPAYRAMLGRIFELVPNIDISRSAMVGFSNGALTLAVLLSSHDEFTLSHFRSFVLVDQGMFHLTDLHEAGAREARYLILVGDQPDMGRDLKLRGCALQQDSWRLLNVDLTCEIMQGTGHAFPPDVMARVGRWLNEAPAVKAAPR